MMLCLRLNEGACDWGFKSESSLGSAENDELHKLSMPWTATWSSSPIRSCPGVGGE